MADVIVSEFVTLDGVMEAPGGEPGHPHTGWVMDHGGAGAEWQRYKLDEILASETLLVGRITYESFAGAWPARTGPFAEKLSAMPKLVASTTLRDPEWVNTTIIDGDVLGAVAAMRVGDGGPIMVHGSRTLVHGLLGAGLVDELRLMTFPVAVGGGGRLFPEGSDKTAFVHVETQLFGDGVALHVYRPAR